MIKITLNEAIEGSPEDISFKAVVKIIEDYFEAATYAELSLVRYGWKMSFWIGQVGYSRIFTHSLFKSIIPETLERVMKYEANTIIKAIEEEKLKHEQN